MTVKPEDYLLLMFSMKAKGKRVDFNHVKEKLTRDLGKFSDAEVRNILTNLVKQGYLKEINGLFEATEEGRKFFAERIKEVEDELKKINESWVIVYKAKQYYPFVADTILEFCKDRYVGFYCLFTEKRFFRRDFRGKKIILKNERDLLFFVDIHCIDVIPCVHRIGMQRPDWLVVDIDPGSKVDFEKTKEVTMITYEIFKELKLNPALKFSGSRGFQIWSLIKDFEIPVDYEPLPLRGGTQRKKNFFSLFSDFVRVIQREVDERIPGLTTSETLGKKEREDKILFDPSSMKPMGLVRSPYAVHSKTGLTSLPLSIKELEEFEKENATIENTLERYIKKGNEFILKESDPSKILELF